MVLEDENVVYTSSNSSSLTNTSPPLSNSYSSPIIIPSDIHLDKETESGKESLTQEVFVPVKMDSSNPSIDLVEVNTEVTDETKRRHAIKRELVYLTSGASIATRRFHESAKWFTRVGFLSKCLLYLSISVLALIAATNEHRGPSGPQRVFAQLNSVSGIFLVLLIIGIFCYSAFGVFFGVFNIDNLSPGGGTKLKRFGRCVSAGFYFFLGINGIQILTHQSDPDKQSNSDLTAALFKHPLGRALLGIIGCTFFVVAVVYFYHAISGAKFRMELATERLGKKRFLVFTTIARIGAIGRVLFFGTFGGAIFQAISTYDLGGPDDPRVLGLQAVLDRAAAVSHAFLFIIGSLIFVYALWCGILCLYRRLPAHPNQNQAIGNLGLNKSLAAVGLPPVITNSTKTLRETKDEVSQGKEIPQQVIYNNNGEETDRTLTKENQDHALDLAERGEGGVALP